MKLSSIKDFFTRRIPVDIRVQKLILAVAVFAVIYTLLILVSMPGRVYLELGRPSTRTIFAPRDIIDEYTTEQLRRAAAEAVPDVFDYKPEVLEEALAAIESFFNTLLELRGDADISPEEKYAALREMLDEETVDATLAALFDADEATINELRQRLEKITTEVFEQGIKVTGVETAQRHLNQEIALFPSIRRFAGGGEAAHLVQRTCWPTRKPPPATGGGPPEVEPVLPCAHRSCEANR